MNLPMNMNKSKRILSFILIFTLVLSTLLIAPVSGHAEAPLSQSTAITAGNTYTISTAEQLTTLSSLVASGTSCAGVTFKLTADIDLNPGVLFQSSGAVSGTPEAFTPIGTATTPFAGAFDGNGKTIRGIYIADTSASTVGLFGTVSGASIANVTLANSYISGNGITGGICGLATNASISACTNQAFVIGGGAITGGVCGKLTGNVATISGCANTVPVSSSSTANGGESGGAGCGGICGVANVTNTDASSISTCYNVASVTASGDSVGGIAGYTAIPLSNSYNAADISGRYYVGGVCGYAYSTINNVYNLSDVAAVNCAGGIAGNMNDIVQAAYSIGQVSATDGAADAAFGSCNAMYDVIYTLEGESATALSSLAGASLPTGFDASIWEKQDSAAQYSYPALSSLPNPDLSCDADGTLLNPINMTATPAAPALPSGETHDVVANYQVGEASSTVYSVDVVWGSLAFTYVDGSMGTWNPETHRYEGASMGAWTCEQGENVITVINHSNIGLTAKFQYEQDTSYQAVNGSFSSPQVTLATAVGTQVDQAPSASTTLTLNGVLPSNAPKDSVVGQVSITFE